MILLIQTIVFCCSEINQIRSATGSMHNITDDCFWQMQPKNVRQSSFENCPVLIVFIWPAVNGGERRRMKERTVEDYWKRAHNGATGLMRGNGQCGASWLACLLQWISLQLNWIQIKVRFLHIAPSKDIKKKQRKGSVSERDHACSELLASEFCVGSTCTSVCLVTSSSLLEANQLEASSLEGVASTHTGQHALKMRAVHTTYWQRAPSCLWTHACKRGEKKS